MAKVIVKCSYLSNKKENREGYLTYIAKREGVVKLDGASYIKEATSKQMEIIDKYLNENPNFKALESYEDYLQNKTMASANELLSEIEEELLTNDEPEKYLKYIAERKGVVRVDKSDHGLFSDEDHLDINEVMDEIKNHEGNIYTAIISLKREDATRLSYDDPTKWKQLIISNRHRLAESFKINPARLNWYAAYHDAAHHPHIHLVIYSSDPKEGYLSEKGIDNIKSFCVNQIFKNELRYVYKDIDSAKMETKLRSSVSLKESDSYKMLKKRMDALSLRLDRYYSRKGGKKLYKYLPKDIKSDINKIIDNLSEVKEVKDAFKEWQRSRTQLISYYNSNKKETRKLSEVKEFNSIKNELIKIVTSEDYNVNGVSLTSSKADHLIRVSLKLLRTMTMKSKRSFSLRSNKQYSSLNAAIKDRMQRKALGQKD